MDDLDAQVRLAAFRFLEEQSRLAPEDGALPRELLVGGFTFRGERVPLMGPQGIFKPRVLPAMPLSITTVPVREGEKRPYDDAFGPDGLLRYRYRGANPLHHENAGLRLAMQRQVALVYFHGVVPGLYVAEWPVYIVGDDPGRLTFTVSVEERRFASLGTLPLESEETEIRRRYVTRLFRQRLHQREFRERVVRAYQHHCAVCRLRRNELLEAAHIVPDADPLGAPSVTNGLALCTLHHAAFDREVIGITPDYIVQVRRDVRPGGRPDADPRASGIPRQGASAAAEGSVAPGSATARRALRALQEAGELTGRPGIARRRQLNGVERAASLSAVAARTGQNAGTAAT